jgi:hypothetical protein
MRDKNTNTHYLLLCCSYRRKQRLDNLARILRLHVLILVAQNLVRDSHHPLEQRRRRDEAVGANANVIVDRVNHRRDVVVRVLVERGHDLRQQRPHELGDGLRVVGEARDLQGESQQGAKRNYSGG